MNFMTEERKEECLNTAEVVDAYRVFPRAFLIVFVTCYTWLVAKSWVWYTSLDFALYDVGQLTVITAFPVALLGALGGMLTSIYKNYQDSGRDWNVKRN